MILHLARNRRRSVVAVESAIVLPVAIMVILGIVVGALAVATYQQVAAVAREAARYASVHGEEYAATNLNNNPAATEATVYTNAIEPRLINMKTDNLTYSVTWAPNKKREQGWVTVTIGYTMAMPLYGTMTFTSTSTLMMLW